MSLLLKPVLCSALRVCEVWIGSLSLGALEGLEKVKVNNDMAKANAQGEGEPVCVSDCSWGISKPESVRQKRQRGRLCACRVAQLHIGLLQVEYF